MEQVIPIGDEDLLRALFGPGDRHLRRLRQRFGVDVVLRDQKVKLIGEEATVIEAASAVQRAIGI